MPGWIETPLYFILGLLITIFGLAGSQRDPATDSTLARPTSNVNS